MERTRNLEQLTTHVLDTARGCPGAASSRWLTVKMQVGLYLGEL